MDTQSAPMSGIYANLPTALTDDQEFDSGRMKEHVQWLLDEGIHGVSCLLSSGEFPYFSRNERKHVIESVVTAVDGRVPVLAGVSADTTSDTVDLAQDAAGLGVDAVMVQPRSYIPLNSDEVVRHFETLAEAVPGRVGIYNNPPATGFNIDPDMYRLLVDRTGAVVTKDGSGHMFNIPQVVSSCGDTMSYLWGTEFLALPALAAGAHGCCIAIASVFPKQLLSIYRSAVEDGDFDAARSSYAEMLPIFRAFKRIGTPRAVKASADILGRSLGSHRLPLSGLADDERDQLRKALAEAGVVA